MRWLLGELTWLWLCPSIGGHIFRIVRAFLKEKTLLTSRVAIKTIADSLSVAIETLLSFMTIVTRCTRPFPRYQQKIVFPYRYSVITVSAIFILKLVQNPEKKFFYLLSFFSHAVVLRERTFSFKVRTNVHAAEGKIYPCDMATLIRKAKNITVCLTGMILS